MKLFLLYIFLFVLATSCELINPKEKIPAYITIDKIDLVSSNGVYGSNSIKITDAWINIDGNLLGIFELPKTFPVLELGKHKIMVRAGIKPNGIAAKRKCYPFYASCTIDTELMSNTVLKLYPKVSLRPETKMGLNENFEENGLYFDTVLNSQVSFIKISDTTAFEGKSGAIILPPDSSIFRCKSASSFVIPYNNQPIYLELNYKNNFPFFVGIFVNTPTSSKLYPAFVYINPSTEWNKVYIELTDMVYANFNYSTFNIYIGVEKPEAQKSMNAEIYLDNIKLFNF